MKAQQFYEYTLYVSLTIYYSLSFNISFVNTPDGPQVDSHISVKLSIQLQYLPLSFYVPTSNFLQSEDNREFLILAITSAHGLNPKDEIVVLKISLSS